MCRGSASRSFWSLSVPQCIIKYDSAFCTVTHTFLRGSRRSRRLSCVNRTRTSTTQSARRATCGGTVADACQLMLAGGRCGGAGVYDEPAADG